MSIRILLGVMTAGAHNLTPSSADVTESGSLNLPEISEPHRPVMEMLDSFLFTVVRAPMPQLYSCELYNITHITDVLLFDKRG
jgi:hypothetical protein